MGTVQLARFSRAAVSACAQCPYKDQVKVWGSGPTPPEVVIVGEAPGADEEREGRGFVGASGRYLRSVLGHAGFNTENLYYTNVISCRPLGNKIESVDGAEAIKCCEDGFRKELSALAESAKVVIAIGGRAMNALGIPGNITAYRGSVSLSPMAPGVPVVATFHPAFMLRGQDRLLGVWGADVAKAFRLATQGWKPPRENFELFPTLQGLRNFYLMLAKRHHPLIAVDIETYEGEISMIGLAPNATTAMVVPFLRSDKGMVKRYWLNAEMDGVRQALERILQLPTMYQHCLFDVPRLRAMGLTVSNVQEDTLLMHHALHPELPHNLGFINSLYGDTPFWKDEATSSFKKGILLPDQTIRTYNARDSVVLHQIYPGLKAHLKQLKLWKTYRETSMALTEPVLAMQKNGIAIDRQKLSKWAGQCQRAKKKADLTLRAMFLLPEAFDLNGRLHMQYLVRGKVSKTIQTKMQIRSDVASGKKKMRTDTKKWADIVETCDVFAAVLPLVYGKAVVRYSDSLDEGALMDIDLALVKRLYALSILKRPRPEHAGERKALDRSRLFFKMFRELVKATTLTERYINYRVKDGRVHARFNIHGTVTGRFSSKEPNLQNIPEAGRCVFVAPEGRTLVNIDYSNLELRVLAVLAHDGVLQAAFDAGQNIHDVNTKALFGTEPESPEWKRMRRYSKTYVFGRGYGGSLPGMYNRIARADPDNAMSYQEFCRLDAAYRGLYPAQQFYREEITRVIMSSAQPVLHNAFGRHRIFLGTQQAAVREGLNFPVQSTAADIINKAMIRIHAGLPKYPGVKIVQQGHDALLFEVLDENAKRFTAFAKKEMERPVKIEGKDRVFPADVATGQVWSDLKDEHHGKKPSPAATKTVRRTKRSGVRRKVER